MAKAVVLLVDDEQEFREVLSRRMEIWGFKVDTAPGGKEALKKVAGKTYDAVILDLAMPEMGGIETLKRMLEIRPELQIIVLTGHATVQDGVEAMKLGAVDFIEKPAEKEKLVAKIEQARDRRQELFENQLDEKISDIMKKKGW
ncbi:MAG: response regulator [candidate division Zixibacteria bacterium]|nr:response regulator [candidate division Zixibacteria bacterium]MDD5426596.1 response regulator [candidate division Zixibacteria bacterium]